METKRVTTGGRRGAKKDVTSKDISKATTKRKGKGAEDANVLRTRSGRTRTAASFDKTATTRKKAANTSMSKAPNIDSISAKPSKEDSSDITEEVDEEPSSSVTTNKVRFKQTNTLFVL